MQMHENVLVYTWTGSGEQYIDIPKGWALQNRKSCHQNGLHHVAKAMVHTTGTGSGNVITFQISGAARNWVVRNSITKAWHLWRDQQKRVYEALQGDSTRPKWQDFKIFLNEDHKDAVVAGTDLLPIAGGPLGNTDAYAYAADSAGALDDGEWVYSKIYWGDLEEVGPTFDVESSRMWIVGSDSGADVGLINQYAQSRATVQSPDPATLPNFANNNIYVKASEPIDETLEVIASSQYTSNDSPPYSPDIYPGSQSAAGQENGNELTCYSWNSFSVVTDFGRTLSLDGFSAPNGLIRVQVAGASSADEHHMALYYVGREAY